MGNAETGALIRRLRTEKGLTQRQLAEALCVGAKAVSKWETGGGCPDVSLLPGLSAALGVDMSRLLAGSLPENDEVSGNMKKLKFYVCPDCGNIMTATAEAELSCCGRRLQAQKPQTPDGEHELKAERVEDEWYVSCPHEMSRDHYIMFTALLTADRLELTRAYPQWELQARYLRRGGTLYWYCTRHGLFSKRI